MCHSIIKMNLYNKAQKRFENREYKEIDCNHLGNNVCGITAEIAKQHGHNMVLPKVVTGDHTKVYQYKEGSHKDRLYNCGPPVSADALYTTLCQTSPTPTSKEVPFKPPPKKKIKTEKLDTEHDFKEERVDEDISIDSHNQQSSHSFCTIS